jgi:hypothetical protein
MAAPPPPVGLGLGLGLGGDSRGERDVEASAAAAHKATALTFMQQQELEHQVLIYRYFAAGAPVPVHLVLPIWKSVASSSFGPHRFPSRTCQQDIFLFLLIAFGLIGVELSDHSIMWTPFLTFEWQ